MKRRLDPPLTDPELVDLLVEPTPDPAPIDRLLDDPEGRELARSLLPLQSWSRDAHREARRSRRRWLLPGGRPALAWSVAVAAALALAIVGPWLVEPHLEPADRAVIHRGPAALDRWTFLPPDGAVLPAPPSALGWTAPAGIADDLEIRVHVFGPDGEPLWSSPPNRAADVSLPLPEAVKEDLVSGAYTWQLSADDGLEVRQSHLLRFEIRP